MIILSILWHNHHLLLCPHYLIPVVLLAPNHLVLALCVLGQLDLLLRDRGVVRVEDLGLRGLLRVALHYELIRYTLGYGLLLNYTDLLWWGLDGWLLLGLVYLDGGPVYDLGLLLLGYLVSLHLCLLLLTTS